MDNLPSLLQAAKGLCLLTVRQLIRVEGIEDLTFATPYCIYTMSDNRVKHLAIIKRLTLQIATPSSLLLLNSRLDYFRHNLQF